MPAAPTKVADVTITEVVAKTMSDEEIADLNTFSNLMRAEANPDDPPTPLETTRISLRTIPSFVESLFLVARTDDGRMVGFSDGAVWNTGDNEHLMECGISVLPEFRRKGIAKAFLRQQVAFAESKGRTKLISGTTERVPAGAEFARVLGAEAGLAEHTNRLLLSKVDEALIGRWIDEGPGRAEGYSLVPIDGAYPKDLYDKIIAVHHIMNTAPRDDLDMEDWKTTPEQMAEHESRMLEQKSERWSLFAQHDASGEWIGYTEVIWNPRQPTIIWQLGTGVDPDHRGHALGKWLKASMLRRILDERTEATDLRTGNADSNDAMLGINDALGFERFEAHTVWQVEVAKVKDYLG